MLKFDIYKSSEKLYNTLKGVTVMNGFPKGARVVFLGEKFTFRFAERQGKV